jgi:hypothetical protein
MINFYGVYNGLEKLDKFDLYAAPLDKLSSIVEHNVEDFESILHIIQKSPREACRHAQWFMPGRWIEAEPAIMTDPYYAYLYASEIIGGRWVEAEPYLTNDNFWCVKYREHYV